MAINGTVLGDLIRSKVDIAVAAHQTADATQRAAIFRAIGDAIVEHFTTAAVVTVTVPSVSGVTTGAGISGPGVGVGSPLTTTGGIT